MPTSNKEHKQDMIEWYKTLNPSMVLDIGAGEGTYSDLMSKLNQSYWTAIEVWGPYVNQFKLKDKYNDLFVCDFRYMDFSHIFWLQETNLVIIGDCLEHLPKEDAMTQIRRLKEFSNNIFISVPHGECPQGTVDGNWFETHLSTWEHDELKSLLSQDGSIIEERKGKVLSAFWWQKNPSEEGKTKQKIMS